MYEFKPHNVETLALNEDGEEIEADDPNADDEEEEEDEGPEEESNIQLGDDSAYFTAG